MPDKQSIARALLFLICAPFLWALHFALLYALQSSYCAGRSHGFLPDFAGAVTAVLVILTSVAALLLLCLLSRPDWAARRFGYAPGNEMMLGFSFQIVRFLSFLSLAGVLWGGMAALALPLCGQLR